MKTLADYMKDEQSEAFKKYGAFFAFGKDQFNEKKKEGVKYTDMGHGLICESQHAKKLNSELDSIHNRAVKKDIEENGLDAIILRALWNHECFYTGDTSVAYEDSLSVYPGITEEKVSSIYYANLKHS